MAKKVKKGTKASRQKGTKAKAKKKTAKKKIKKGTKAQGHKGTKKKAAARKPAKPKMVNYSAEKHPEAGRVAASEGFFSHRGLAEKLRVPKSSIGRWMRDHQAFKDAVGEGKKENVERIEESFHRLAAGGIKRTKTKQELVGKGKAKKMKVTEKTTETTLPHAGAAQRILAAHKPEIYRNKAEIDLNAESLVDALAKVGIL